LTLHSINYVSNEERIYISNVFLSLIFFRWRIRLHRRWRRQCMGRSDREIKAAAVDLRISEVCRKLPPPPRFPMGNPSKLFYVYNTSTKCIFLTLKKLVRISQFKFMDFLINSLIFYHYEILKKWLKIGIFSLKMCPELKMEAE